MSRQILRKINDLRARMAELGADSFVEVGDDWEPKGSGMVDESCCPPTGFCDSNDLLTNERGDIR
jgi:hypothetical protein